MFERILVANRGEIACRIVSTARRLGIATVAVHSDADRDALHVEMADMSVRIGPAPAAQSYLDVDAIVAACRATGADAVHPGYGFLSERAAFAERLAAEGIAFIGPNPAAIAAMGDKIRSKEIAAAAGVRVVPGYVGEVETPDHAVALAAEIGFPVLLKASAGGGGKGMRIARNAPEILEAYGLARSEAISAFGDGRLLIERYIDHPRHIEVQVLADRHGTVVHLGERECSIQRRHQKVIEEAPSPFLDPATRAGMGAQAVALARAVGYDSAGTVEFVVGPDRQFYFLEMNTRLQVEHPVTECVTGLDLVEQMIRVAAGEPLAFAQADIRCDGWAVEARLYAEDPRRGFLPSVGRLTRYQEPPAGDGLRVDSGVVEGSEISIYYDPMIAKAIAHGPTRAAAIDRLADGLDRFIVDGPSHNLGFLSALMAHPRWQAGDISTGFIAEAYGDAFAGIEPDDRAREVLATVALAMRLADEARRPGRQPPAGTRVVAVDRQAVVLGWVREESGGLCVTPDGGGAFTVVSGWRPGEPVWAGTVGGLAVAVQIRPATAGVRLSWRGIDVHARVMTPTVASLAALMPEKAAENGSRQLRCPMPGRLVSLAVAEGQAVKAGETLAVVEAMKMENVLRAERDAVVERIAARLGETLAVDAVILEFAA